MNGCLDRAWLKGSGSIICWWWWWLLFWWWCWCLWCWCWWCWCWCWWCWSNENSERKNQVNQYDDSNDDQGMNDEIGMWIEINGMVWYDGQRYWMNLELVEWMNVYMQMANGKWMDGWMDGWMVNDWLINSKNN